ncbi:MAG: hypothetical protein ACQEVA_05390 [Myxococcota bacterium]
MARRHTAFLLVLLASAALLAACGPDRFSDSGCETDDDCRGERMCVEGLCVGEGRVPDAGDDSGTDVADEEDAELDIGTEEDTSDVELDPFIGNWELEGPITVVTEDGDVLQQTEPQPFPTTIDRGDDSDLFVDIEPLDGCSLLADTTGPGEFGIRPRDCESSPVDQLQGDAAVVEGDGRLMEDGTSLTLAFRIQLDSMDFGTIFLEFSLVGPRLAP